MYTLTFSKLQFFLINIGVIFIFALIYKNYGNFSKNTKTNGINSKNNLGGKESYINKILKTYKNYNILGDKYLIEAHKKIHIFPPQERIIVIGDIHGDFKVAIRCLILARCIKNIENGNIYKIDQMHLKSQLPLKDNTIILKNLKEGGVIYPLISQLENYIHVRCTENDNDCKSVKFKDDFLLEACSSKGAYDKFKKNDLTADQMLNKKYNKNCEKDAEILRKKCDMMKNNKNFSIFD
jgi:hypothetical protein